ncbi:hypothetical protein ACHHYP_05034 [Achlya hypogyna]|uniref:TOG domain-containing protein n=1 Tax=Achlya hypogyna TaxID=1202772 RepID=A0A1V9YYX2_ACHHY|nr:hypothetical protein ACHHYP_05034 [Achlya hypogyna]
MQATLGWRSRQSPLDGFAARLKVSDEEWKLKVEALRDVLAFVAANTGAISQENLSCLVVPFRSMFLELRSAVVKEACEVFAKIAELLGQKTKLFISNVFSTMIDARGGTNKVNSSAIHSCIERVLKVVMSRHILSTFFYVSKTSKNSQMRDACVQYMLILLKHWSLAHLDPHRLQIQDFISNALSDASPTSRETGRTCYSAFAIIWPEWKDSFLMTLDPSVKKHLARQLEVVTVNAHTASPRETLMPKAIVTPQSQKRKILTNITNTPDTVKRRRNLPPAKANGVLTARAKVSLWRVGDAHATSKQTGEVENVAAQATPAIAVKTPHSNHETLKSLSASSPVTISESGIDSPSPELYFDLLCEKKSMEKKLGALQAKYIAKSDALALAQESLELTKMQREDAAARQATAATSANAVLEELSDQVASMSIKLQEKDTMILSLELNLNESRTALQQTSVMLTDYNASKEQEVSALKAQVAALELQSSLQASMNNTSVHNDAHVADLQAQVDELAKEKAVLKDEVGCMDETISSLQASLFEEQQQVELMKQELAAFKQASTSSEQADQLRIQLQDQLAIVEALHIECAKRDADAAVLTGRVAALSQSVEGNDVKLALALKENSTLRSELDDLRAKAEELTTNEAVLVSKLEALQARRALELLSAKDVTAQLQAEVASRKDEASTLLAENLSLTQARDAAMNQHDEMAACLEETTGLVALYKAKLEQQGSEGVNLEHDLALAETEKQALRTANNELTTTSNQLAKRVRDLEEMHDMQKDLYETLRAKLEHSANEGQQLRGTLTVTSEELEHAEERAKLLHEDVVELQDRVQDLTTEVRCLQECLEAAEKERDKRQVTVDALEQQLLALQEDDFQRQCRYEDTVKIKTASISLLERQVKDLEAQLTQTQEQNSALQLHCETLETRAFVSSKEREDQVLKWQSDQTAFLNEKEVLVLTNTRLAKEISEWKASTEAKQGVIDDLQGRVRTLETALAQWTEKEIAWATQKQRLESTIAERSEAMVRHEESLASVEIALHSSKATIIGLEAERCDLGNEVKRLERISQSMEKALADVEAKKVLLQNQVIVGLERLREYKIEKAEPTEAVIAISEPVLETPSPVQHTAPLRQAQPVDTAWKLKASMAPSLFQVRPSKANVKAQRQLNDANLLKRFESRHLPQS